MREDHSVLVSGHLPCSQVFGFADLKSRKNFKSKAVCCNQEDYVQAITKWDMNLADGRSMMDVNRALDAGAKGELETRGVGLPPGSQELGIDPTKDTVESRIETLGSICAPRPAREKNHKVRDFLVVGQWTPFHFPS